MLVYIAFQVRLRSPIPLFRHGAPDVTMTDVVFRQEFKLRTRSWTEVTLAEIEAALIKYWPAEHVADHFPRGAIDVLEEALEFVNTCYLVEGARTPHGVWRRLDPGFSREAVVAGKAQRGQPPKAARDDFFKTMDEIWDLTDAKVTNAEIARKYGYTARYIQQLRRENPRREPGAE